jgi:hypothetical protein
MKVCWSLNKAHAIINGVRIGAVHMGYGQNEVTNED